MIQSCIFDLYGTLVDIHTDEGNPEVWKKLALFFSYYGADYEPEELKEAYSLQVRKLTETFRKEQEKKELEREKSMQKAMLEIKKKFGKNAILKGMNLEEGATAKDRNAQIGGHKA